MAENKGAQSKGAPGADAVGDDAVLDQQENTKVKPAPKRKPAGEGILPKKASEDDPRRWGDEPGYDHDAWLKEQRPPHWG